MLRPRFLTGMIVSLLAAGCAAPAGVTSMAIDARAPGFGLLQEAPVPCAEQTWAVFAKSSLVDLTISGHENRVEGDVQTNCVFKLVGSNNTVAGTAITAQGYFIHGQDLEAKTTPKVPEAPFPFAVNVGAIAPTFTFDGSVNLNSRPEVWQSPGVLKPGVYLSTGTIEVSGQGLTGKVTLIGAQVQIHGSDMQLEAFAQGVLAHATDAGQAIHISSEGGHYVGLLDAPNGKVSLNGAKNTFEGAVLADVFELDGANNTITRKDTGFCPAAETPPAGFTLTGLVSSFAGTLERTNPGCLPLTDGSRLNTAFSQPHGLAWDLAGNLLVADTGNFALRRITPGGRVNTLASSTMTAGASFQMRDVTDMAVHRDGTIYFTNSSNHTIGKLSPDGKVSVVAGSSTFTSGETDAYHRDGPADQARFYLPYGIAVYNDLLYVSEGMLGIIRRIDLKTGMVTTLAGAKVPSSTGNCVCIAYFPGYSDGQGTNGRFNGTYGIAVDKDGNLFIADEGNNAIRKMTPDGTVTTYAGDVVGRTCTTTACGLPVGLVDGPANKARFKAPHGLDFDAAGNLYVADTGNNAIRKIAPDGTVTTVAGDGQAGLVNGASTQARFATPADVLVDPQGALYVADQNNNAIRKIQ